MRIREVNKKNDRFLVPSFIIIVVLFLYFGSGAMLDGGVNYGIMDKTGWLGGHSWRWFPAVITLIFGLTVGWLLFRKKI
jgi:uncharacterized membrane protein